MRTSTPRARAALMAAPAGFALLLLAGCGSSAAGSAAQSTSAVGYSSGRVAALHAAAECIRTHGIPTYQDPVLTADGHVYSDSRSIEDFSRSAGGNSDAAINALRRACAGQLSAAALSPQDEPPAPPQLVQAGVVAARCLRAHGLPTYRDPTSETPFTPGHGFGVTADEMPNNGALGKTDPTFQRATQACRAELDAEIRASELSSLAHD